LSASMELAGQFDHPKFQMALTKFCRLRAGPEWRPDCMSLNPSLPGWTMQSMRGIDLSPMVLMQFSSGIPLECPN